MLETNRHRGAFADPPAHSVHALARQQLAAICGAVEMAADRAQAVAAAFDGLALVCGDQPLDRPPRWSGMTDDCTPIEWSVAFGHGEPDVRVLVEAQRDPASVASYWDASQDLTRWAVDHLGGDSRLVSEVIDVFAPTNPDAYAAAYHGVEFRHDNSVRTKVYINPAIAGDRWAVVRAALDRLGLTHQVDALLAAVGPLDVPLVAFDLEPAGSARVKLYLRSESLDVLKAVGELCDPPGGVDHLPFVRGLYGDEALGRRPFVALHLAAGRAGPSPSVARPSRAVLSLPMYEPPESQPAVARIATLLEAQGLDAACYRRVVDALHKVQPPDTPDVLGAYGMHSWVSFQREPDGGARITVYFRLRAFAHRYGWLGADPVRTWPRPLSDRAAP